MDKFLKSAGVDIKEVLKNIPKDQISMKKQKKSKRKVDKKFKTKEKKRK